MRKGAKPLKCVLKYLSFRGEKNMRLIYAIMRENELFGQNQKYVLNIRHDTGWGGHIFLYHLGFRSLKVNRTLLGDGVRGTGGIMLAPSGPLSQCPGPPASTVRRGGLRAQGSCRRNSSGWMVDTLGVTSLGSILPAPSQILIRYLLSQASSGSFGRHFPGHRRRVSA